jgi:transcriptional regulator with XRE-family HTH domain
MITAKHATRQDFPSACRRWRQHRKLSQLDLALAANVSQRHVSWLETGRSQPSREMVVRLADAMEIPLRERNLLFQAAGYAATYRETRLDAPAMAPVLDALNHVLHNHEPLPAVVVDRFWNVIERNRAAGLMLDISGDSAAMQDDADADGELNLALLTVHPHGLRRFIVNWEQAGAAFVRRLKCEALAAGDPRVRTRFARYIELAGPLPGSDAIAESLLPFLPLELNIDGLELSLFSVISTFGTPQDITTDELRIEAFYPANTATAEFFRSLAR